MNKAFAKLKRIQDRLTGTDSQSVETPYEIECDCGATVKGIRRKSWIESECPACAQSVFVLPMNVYPSTKSVPSEILGGTFRERLKVVTGELLQGYKSGKDTDDVDSDAKSPSNSASKKSKADEDVVVKPKWKMPKLALPRIDFKRLLARTFSPFRLLMMAVLATVGITGWLMVSQRQFAKAQKDWLESTASITEKLDSGELAGLLPDLEHAIQAGTVLEKDDAEFRRWNNLLVESRAFDELSTVGLVDVFHSAYNDENHLKPDAGEVVTTGCSDGWFLIDAQASPTTSGGSSWMIDFPVTPGLHPVSIVLPDESIGQLFQDAGSFRILFVAQLEVQKVPSANEDGQWVLAANPASFALMTHTAHCEAAGFEIDNDPDLQQIIARQQQWVEAGKALASSQPNAP